MKLQGELGSVSDTHSPHPILGTAAGGYLTPREGLAQLVISIALGARWLLQKAHNPICKLQTLPCLPGYRVLWWLGTPQNVNQAIDTM